MEHSSLEMYNQSLEAVRERFDANPALNALRSNSDPRMLELFLLHFCALGAQMTKPVENWIRRASLRCAELGFAQLAKALSQHAQAESGHDLMMIADVHALANHWNSRHSPPVDADELLRQAPGKGARNYCEVHEQNITGNAPYAQIAIEYEIEQLPLRYGTFFLTRCLEVFGPEILPNLSFVSAHIDLDVGHTYFNERELAKLIDSTPESLPALVAAGTDALDSYADFLSDCVALAEHHYSTIRKSSNWSQFLSWQLQPPLDIEAAECSALIPKWLEESRALRGAVLFNHGRRPHFRRPDGGYDDPDPIDFYAWHVLAYHRSVLVGCVRVYPITEDGPPSFTESILGTDEFNRMLASLGKQREDVIEIGRWVVDPAFRNGGSLAPGIGLELAAGAGALALTLADQIESGNGIAIFAAGTRDRQYFTLTRLGLKMFAGLSPVRSSEYDDFIQVLHCDSATPLQPRLRRIIESLSIAMRIEETVQSVQNRTLYTSSAGD